MQRDAAARIQIQPALMLLADMGWGKTAATLTALRNLTLFSESPAVIVAPKRVAVDERTWEVEGAKWAPELTFSLVHGTPKKRRDGAHTKADAYICTWDSLHTDEVQALLTSARVLVLDELSYAKGWTRRVKSLRKHTFSHQIGLTGTPAPNGLLDLFYPVMLLDDGARFGKNKETFKRKYFYPLDYQGYKWAPRSEDAIYNELGSLVFRGENIDLPPVQPQKIQVPLTVKQREVYQELEREFLVGVESGTVTAANAAVLANKLRQCAAGFLIDTENGQVNWLTPARTMAVRDLLSELGQPALVVYEYQAQKEALLACIDGARTLDDPGAIEDWNKGEVPALVMHARSGGHGLNLQFGSNHVIWCSLTWSWELWAQLNARLARPGQVHDTVFAHVMESPGTVEGHVYDVLVEKGESELRLLDWAATQAG